MAYQVYRKEVGSEKVEPVSDDVYETREEAEMALNKAQSELKAEQEEMTDIPALGEAFGPGQTNLPGDELVTGEDEPAKERNVEFFIRET